MFKQHETEGSALKPDVFSTAMMIGGLVMNFGKNAQGYNLNPAARKLLGLFPTVSTEEKKQTAFQLAEGFLWPRKKRDVC